MVYDPLSHSSAPSDYTAVVNAAYVLSAEMRDLEVMIPLVDDSIREPLESFSVTISLPCNQSGVLLGQSLASIVINDDDSKYCTDYSLVPIFCILLHHVMESPSLVPRLSPQVTCS